MCKINAGFVPQHIEYNWNKIELLKEINFIKMTQETKQEIKQHLAVAKGDSVLATSLRRCSSMPESYKANIVSIKQMINDNAPVMLDILGVDGFQYFKKFQLPTDFAPVESEGVE